MASGFISYWYKTTLSFHSHGSAAGWSRMSLAISFCRSNSSRRRRISSDDKRSTIERDAPELLNRCQADAADAAILVAN